MFVFMAAALFSCSGGNGGKDAQGGDEQQDIESKEETGGDVSETGGEDVFELKETEKETGDAVDTGEGLDASTEEELEEASEIVEVK
ncbi:MAG: hypothetical protein FJ088_05285, partial [Deltaproteobacteria bacterium]|nr:hypothetical protein [Deltaproteobacteria bacterium]